jgi:putative phosphoesterase
VGLISDTHGLMRPAARSFLCGCDHIVHGGDVGAAAILDELSAIAPLTAVRGNNDTEPWAQNLRDTAMIEVGDVCIYAIHDLAELDIDPGAAGVRVVVSGHSHIPKVEERASVLFVNPGSCGPRRFKLPIALGELIVERGAVSAHIVELEDSRTRSSR